MVLADRDRHITNYIARFGQLTSAQVYDLVFDGAATKTPCDRALRRLTDSNHLARIERRLVGGTRGGSGQYVYQLGSAVRSSYQSAKRPVRAVNYHSLAIGDAFITIIKLARAGRLELVGYSTEPDCWLTIGRHELKPDLFTELARPGGQPVPFWFEIDMGTEGQRHLKEKFVRYWQASKDASSDIMPVWPIVVLVAVDDDRRQELRWLLEQGNPEQRKLFRLTTLAELGDALA